MSKKGRPDPRPFTLWVDHPGNPPKTIAFWTAKAARLEAKRLAGVKGVASVSLHHHAEDAAVYLLWEAGR